MNPTDQIFVETRAEYDENKRDARIAYAICAAAVLVVAAIFTCIVLVQTSVNDREVRKAEVRAEVCNSLRTEEARALCIGAKT